MCVLRYSIVAVLTSSGFASVSILTPIWISTVVCGYDSFSSWRLLFTSARYCFLTLY